MEKKKDLPPNLKAAVAKRRKELGQVKPLSANESARLAQLKKEIDENLKGFVVVCMAVAEIQERELHRENYDTVEQFFKGEFDLSRGRFYQLLDAARVVNSCRQMELDWIPANEAQARAVAKIVKSDENLLPGIIEMAVESTPDGKITAGILAKATKTVMGEKTTAGMKKRRSQVSSERHISADFKSAFLQFVNAIEEARDTKYKQTDRNVIIEHLDAVRAIVAEDGAVIDDQDFSVATSDAIKLEKAGYSLFRADRSSKTIKIRAGGGWPKHSGPYETYKEMEADFTVLMQNKKHLRG